MLIDWTSIIVALISATGLVVIALLPKKEVKKLREENTVQHQVNKSVAEETHKILERFEADADYDRKSILKAVTAVERKVERVDDRVEKIDDRLGNHIEWHLDKDS